MQTWEGADGDGRAADTGGADRPSGAPSMTCRRAARAFMMAMAMACLAAAVWAGLLRLGLPLPVLTPLLPALHGPLMVVGFLGTLVSLERAAALGRWWTFGGPLFMGGGTLLALAGVPGRLPTALAAAGSAVLVLAFAEILRRQLTIFNGVMALASLSLLSANLLWLARRPFSESVWLWAAFLVLTIVGERLELTRLLRLTPWKVASFVAACAVATSGAAATPFAYSSGVSVLGAGFVLLAVWLLSYDIARRTVRQRGLTRYVAVCLLVGYVWLGLSGCLLLASGPVTAGVRYDAVLHALFLGFVFSMIFGHAPIIFPAVLGVPIPFRRVFYLHLAALHLSLALRVAGDLLGSATARQWGGALNAAALLLFLANTVAAAAGSRAQKAGAQER